MRARCATGPGPKTEMHAGLFLAMVGNFGHLRLACARNDFRAEDVGTCIDLGEDLALRLPVDGIFKHGVWGNQGR